MTDRYLQETHSLTITRDVPTRAMLAKPVADEKTSWVMLSQSGALVKLPGEHILHTTNARVGLDVSVPKSLQGHTSAATFTLKSDNGTAYITNERVSLELTAATRRERDSTFC